jgi:hypothetical protein
MKTRPRGLNVISILFFGIAIGLPLQVAWMFEHAPWEIVPIGAKLTPLNWAILTLSALSGFLALRASRALLVSLPVLVLLVVYNNWLVGAFGMNYAFATTLFSSGLFLFVLGISFTRSTLNSILEPKLRWWMTPTRLQTRLPVFVWNREGIQQFETETFDISETGAFIVSRLEIGTKVDVLLPLQNCTAVQCQAEVVRASEPRGKYPAGVGVRFLNLSWSDQRKLRTLLGQMA